MTQSHDFKLHFGWGKNTSWFDHSSKSHYKITNNPPFYEIVFALVNETVANFH